LSIAKSNHAPRSNSMMISKPQTIKKQAVIEGSFIMLDDAKRKLTDMGQFRSIGNSADVRAQKDIIDRRSRFVKNF